MTRSCLLALALLSACGSASPAPAPVPVPVAPPTAPTSTPPPPPAERSVAAVIADFRADNRPSMTDGVPGASTMTDAQFAAHCAAFHRVLSQISDAGFLGMQLDAGCRATFTGDIRTTAGLAALNGTLVFDLAFFRQAPYAAARFDAATRTLYLPLEVVASHTLNDAPTTHELWHVELFADLLAKQPEAYPFGFVFAGPDFKPDALHADELVAYGRDLCLRAKTHEYDLAAQRLQPLEMHTQAVVDATAELTHPVSAEAHGAAITVSRVDEQPANGKAAKAGLARLNQHALALRAALPAIRAAVEHADDDALRRALTSTKIPQLTCK